MLRGALVGAIGSLRRGLDAAGVRVAADGALQHPSINVNGPLADDDHLDWTDSGGWIGRTPKHWSIRARGYRAEPPLSAASEAPLRAAAG